MRTLTHSDYKVGWICALPLEAAAAVAMLDELHGPIPQHPSDLNSYHLGCIGKHNVVIGCLPIGRIGTHNAAIVATHMGFSFQSIKINLMVGIGGGIPSEKNDIRLGDVVVSKPGSTNSGVIQYDFGRVAESGDFTSTCTVDATSPALLSALSTMEVNRLVRGNVFSNYLSQIPANMQPQFNYPGTDKDLLFEADYEHVGVEPGCNLCDPDKLTKRKPRPSIQPVVHYGTILSANRVIRHGGTREELRKRYDALCVEMEAAGLMSQFRCAVIRGICDYSDTHKNKRWQHYAALTAAAYAKELIEVVPIEYVTSSSMSLPASAPSLMLNPIISHAAVSLPFQLFAGCIKGLSILAAAHNFGKEAAILRCRLNLEEYLLTEWAQQAGLLDDEPKLHQNLNERLVEEVLIQLNELLTDKELLKRRYKLELTNAQPVSQSGSPSIELADDSPIIGILKRVISEERRQEILTRAKLIQSITSFPESLWWVSIDQKNFENLLEQIGYFIQKLWKILDPLERAELRSHIQVLLSTVICLEKKVDELAALQLALIGSEVKVASLATSAGWKVLRTLDEDCVIANQSMERSGQSICTDPNATAQNIQTPTRLNLLPAPLWSDLLHSFVPKDQFSNMGIAQYDRRACFVEYKDFHPKFKQKLKSRVENLAALLHAPKDESIRILHCEGVIEESHRGQYAFVYQHPVGNGQPKSLYDLLCSGDYYPSVSHRTSLALDLARTIYHLHTAGWLHKDLRSANILFFPPLDAPQGWKSISEPFIVGFAYARNDSPSEISEQPSTNPERDIYRHPSALGEPSMSFNRLCDIYSFGTILLELAHWRPLKKIVSEIADVKKDLSTAEIAKVKDFLVQIAGDTAPGRPVPTTAFRMGDIYSRITMRCLIGDFSNAGIENEECLQIGFFNSVLKELEKIVI